MVFEYFIQVLTRGILLSILDSIAYFFDLYWPFVTILVRCTMVAYLFKYKDTYQAINTSQRNELVSRIYFLEVLSKKFRDTRILDTLKWSRYLGSVDVYYEATCIIFAFLLRSVIDLIRYLLHRNNVKESIESEKTSVSDAVLAFCYILHILFLFYWAYAYGDTASYRLLTLSGFFRYYLYTEHLLLLSGFLGLSLMSYIMREYTAVKDEDTIKKTWYTLRNAGHLFLDTGLRLICIHYAGLLYYVALCEQISEIIVLSVYVLRNFSVGTSVYQTPRSPRSLKTKTHKYNLFTRWIGPGIGVYVLCFIMEYQLVNLDFDLNTDVNVLFLSLICESFVYFCLYCVRKKELKNKVYEYIPGTDQP